MRRFGYRLVVSNSEPENLYENYEAMMQSLVFGCFMRTMLSMINNKRFTLLEVGPGKDWRKNG